MNKNNLNISEIETFLYGLFNGEVGERVVVGSKVFNKAEIPNDCNSFCHIDLPNGVNDMDAYGQGTALVALYARPMESGRKNVKVLSEMEVELNRVLAESANPNYKVIRRLTYSSFNRDIDWHCNVVEVIITVL
jgi:hypothetical protein